MRRKLLAVPLAVLAVVLAACGSSPSGGNGASGAPTGPPGTALPTVTGAFGTKPTVSVPSSNPPAGLKATVLSQGAGPAVAKGQLVAINYLGEVWKSKKVFDTSFGAGRTAAAFPIGTGQVITGFDNGIVGKAIGSRVLLVIPPADGYGKTGNTQIGITGTDTLVFVVDLLGAVSGNASAAGTPAPALGASLPKVSTATGKPTIIVPKIAAPKTLVVKTIIAGTGATVKSGDLLVVQYVGVKWATGTAFDSSWTRGTPAGFGIGVGQVIKGWDAGLVGRRIGDRVLLVVPPAYGYGAQGRSQAGISGTDTLVFAVDVIAVFH